MMLEDMPQNDAPKEPQAAARAAAWIERGALVVCERARALARKLDEEADVYALMGELSAAEGQEEAAAARRARAVALRYAARHIRQLMRT
jgi:hypothetical protein